MKNNEFNTAIQISEELFSQLANKGRMSLAVHSIFDNACNLVTPEGNLVTLLPCGRLMSPNSIMLERRVWVNGWEINDSVVLQLGAATSDSRLYVISINPDSVKTVSSAILKQNQHDLPITRAQFEQFLCSKTPELGIYPLMAETCRLQQPPLKYYSGVMSEYIAYDLHVFVDQIRRGEKDIDLKQIVGFGAGLTPSMDDVLVGVLSYLDYRGHIYFDAIANACRQHMHRTTDVSKNMLDLATTRQFNHGLIALYAAMGDRQAFMLNLDSICQFGHSSGHDTLCGVYLAAFIVGIWFQSAF